MAKAQHNSYIEIEWTHKHTCSANESFHIHWKETARPEWNEKQISAFVVRLFPLWLLCLPNKNKPKWIEKEQKAEARRRRPTKKKTPSINLTTSVAYLQQQFIAYRLLFMEDTHADSVCLLLSAALISPLSFKVISSHWNVAVCIFSCCIACNVNVYPYIGVYNLLIVIGATLPLRNVTHSWIVRMCVCGILVRSSEVIISGQMCASYIIIDVIKQQATSKCFAAASIHMILPHPGNGVRSHSLSSYLRPIGIVHNKEENNDNNSIWPMLLVHTIWIDYSRNCLRWK